MSSSWDNARKHARALETALEAKLSAYSKAAVVVARSSNTPGSSSVPEDGEGDHELLEEQVEELLSKASSSLAREGRC